MGTEYHTGLSAREVLGSVQKAQHLLSGANLDLAELLWRGTITPEDAAWIDLQLDHRFQAAFDQLEEIELTLVQMTRQGSAMLPETRLHARGADLDRGWVEFTCPRHTVLVAASSLSSVRCGCGRRARAAGFAKRGFCEPGRAKTTEWSPRRLRSPLRAERGVAA